MVARKGFLPRRLRCRKGLFWLRLKHNDLPTHTYLSKITELFIKTAAAALNCVIQNQLVCVFQHENSPCGYLHYIILGPLAKWRCQKLRAGMQSIWQLFLQAAEWLYYNKIMFCKRRTQPKGILQRLECADFCIYKFNMFRKQVMVFLTLRFVAVFFWGVYRLLYLYFLFKRLEEIHLRTV